MKLEEGNDVQHLPAYAVYRNLIPGVKVYQDTNTPSEKSSRKKKRKSLAQAASTPNPNPTPKSKPISNGNGVLNGGGKAATPVKSTVVAPPVTPKPSAPTETPSSEGKKRKRKRKSNKNDASNLEPDADTPIPAKTRKSSTTEAVLLPNPFAKKQQQQQNGNSKTPVKQASSTTIITPTTTTTTNLPGGSSKKEKVVQNSNNNNVGSTPIPNNKNKSNTGQQQNKQKVKSSTIENGTPKNQDKKGNKDKDKITNNSNTKVKNGNESNSKLQQKRISLTNLDKNNDNILESSNQTKANKKKKSKASKNKNNTQNGSPSISSPSDANNTRTDRQLNDPSLSSDEEDPEVEDEIPIEILLSSRHSEDSVEHGKYLFQWLISPTPITTFMTDNWEKSPLLIKRVDRDYYKWLLTSSKLDAILRNNVIRFGKNIDITSYTDGQRETHNPVGRALPPAVWDYYSNGCSVRFLNPQTYNKALWRVNAMLQEFFGTFVGANVYLTPPDSQGFAPHYDDIEAFILQIEGKKHWKVYKPRTEGEELPRFSSANFSEETDNLGKPVLDVVLEEGDLLYFPRGYIHQAKAVDEHSLHITLSCYQQNSWGDLLKEHLSTAVDQAMASSVEFRRGLPLDYLSYMGIAHAESKDKAVVERRRDFIKHAKSLVHNLMNFTTPDQAADNMGKKFMWDSLPPYFVHGDKKASSFGDGEFMDDGKVYNRCELDPDVEVKLIRQNCVRLVFEENALRLYFTLENSLEYHGEEVQFVEIPMEAANGIKKIISSYPDYVKIDDLPMPNVIDKVQVIADLWERGIVVTKDELTVKIDDGDEDDMVDEDMIDIGDDDTEDEESDDSEYDEYDNDDFYDNDMSNFLVDDSDEDDEEDSEDFMDADDSENDSEEDEHGLGKSFVEEIHSDDEVKEVTKGTEKKNLKTPTQSKKQKKSVKLSSASEDDDDDEIVPQLVPATPNSQPKQKQQQVQDKTPKNKNKKNKKKKLNT